MKTWPTLPFLAACAALLAAPNARAGIVDSPLPVLMAGKTMSHLYSVPGVRRGSSLQRLGAYPRDVEEARVHGVPGGPRERPAHIDGPANDHRQDEAEGRELNMERLALCRAS